MLSIDSIYRYPVKGFSGEEMFSIKLNSGEGIKDDRRYAIANGISDTKEGAWLACRLFFINAVNDGLLKFANESDEDFVTLSASNGTKISWKRGDAQSLAFANRKLAEFIAPLQPARDLPAPIIAERTQLPGSLSGYWDFTDSAISIMNTASLQEVGQALGAALDKRRLRGNLYVADLAPWEEFKWLGKHLRFGTAELEILRPVKRCPATMVNPETGDRDAAIPAALAEHFGHGFCGMYAKVVKPGNVSKGDSIEVLGEATARLEEAANPEDTPVEIWPKPIVATVTDLQPSGEQAFNVRLLKLKPMTSWKLFNAKPGQRIRFQLGPDLTGVVM